MLQLSLNLTEINYENIVKMAYPTLLEKLSQNRSRNLLFRLIAKLGDDGEAVLLRLMSKLPLENRNQLVCHCLNSYSPVLVGTLNDYLREDPLGRHFVLDRIEAEQIKNCLVLTAQNVQVDFKALLNAAREAENLKKITGKVVGSRLLGAFAAKATAKAAKQAAHVTNTMTSEELEIAGVVLLNRDTVRQKLLGVISKALAAKRIPLNITQIHLESTDLAVYPEKRIADVHTLPENLEDALIQALADFLRGTIYVVSKGSEPGSLSPAFE